MPIDVILVLSLSLLAIAFALWRGSSPEKIGAAIIALDLIIDFAVRGLGDRSDFSFFSESRLAIDVIEFGLLGWLALNANRVWPIFSAAAQLVAVGGSLPALHAAGGNQIAYWAVTQTPLFGQILALALGTFFHMRRQAIIGRYRDWRAPALSAQG